MGVWGFNGGLKRDLRAGRERRELDISEEEQSREDLEKHR